MLHRLSLRVIPQLGSAVTERAVRKRKRLVMLVPGLVAFGVYHLLKLIAPLSDPWVLLGLSGVLSALASVWAFRMGRRVPIGTIFGEEPLRYLAWIIGWVGFAYGVQLALLVLALLGIFVLYDFLLHPDGPAMMALIIATTAVTRDAFELGHIRKLVYEGTQVVTQPDGATLGKFARSIPRPLIHWVFLTLVAVLGAGWVVSRFSYSEFSHAVQIFVVSAVIGTLAYAAFLAGQAPNQNWRERSHQLTWWKGLKFWVWPCLTFALTYELVAAGIVKFLWHVPLNHPGAQALMIGSASVLMAVYFYYLGTRVLVETQALGEITEGMRRCPFVMEILTKTGWVSPSQAADTASLNVGHSK